MTEIAHFIDNARVAGASGRRQPVYNPATGEAEKTVALASIDEVNAAVASAKTAWASWSKTPPLRRARPRPLQDDLMGPRGSTGRGDQCRTRQDSR